MVNEFREIFRAAGKQVIYSYVAMGHAKYLIFCF